MNRIVKIVLLVVLMVGFACSSSKKTASNKKIYTDEQIETDAFAKANLDCSYKLAQLDAIAHPKDKQLDGKAYKLVVQQREFEQKVKSRYFKDSVYKHKYQNYYKKARQFFKSCQQLEAIENPPKK